MEFVFVKKIVDEWAKAGHHCIVITSFSKTAYKRGTIEYKPELYREEITTDVTVDVYNPRFISTGLNIAGVSLNSWAAAHVIEKKIKSLKIKFDLFYCHFFASAILVYRYASQHQIPLFVATGESNVKLLNKPYPGFRWDAFRKYIKGVVAVSTKNKDDATKFGMINPQKCRVFPNGTDISFFKPYNRMDCRMSLGLPQDAFIVSCVGFFCERKGQDRLLKAVRKIGNNNIKLLFLGRAAKFDTFQLEGDEILFKGSVENKDLPQYLCASDVFCLPTRAEGCCNAIIEALACGLPVISSNRPFNRDVLDDTNSILIDPDNIGEISEALRMLRENPLKRKELSEGAVVRSHSLSINQRAKDILLFMGNNVYL